MTNGILCGLGAAALWALTYFLPLYVSEFSSIEITCGRYLSYGLFSLVMWQFGSCSIRNVPRWIVVRTFQFAALAYVGFYALHVLGIKLIGAGFATLIIAFLPVALSIYGNIVHKEFPFSLLALPLAIISLGQLAIHLTEASFDSTSSRAEIATGVGACLVAVACWSWYGCESGRIMRVQREIGAKEISNLIGIACLILSALLLTATFFVAPQSLHLVSADLDLPELRTFFVVSVILGIFTSWLPGILWQNTVRLVPVSLAGQLLVSEICLALIYIYLYDWRLPTLWEAIGIGLVVGGISLAIIRTSRASQ